MKTSWTGCTARAGLAGVAALIAVMIGDAPARTVVKLSAGMAQYCAPAAENAETQRVFCRSEHG